MPRILATLALALAGLLCAAGIGAAAYYVSRDSVGLPVTKLQPKGLAPAAVRPATPTTSVPSVSTPTPTTTVTGGSDDHGGGGHGRGHGEDD